MALSNAALDQKMVENMSRFLCNPFQSKAFDLKTPARTDLVRSAFSHIFRGFAVRKKSPQDEKHHELSEGGEAAGIGCQSRSFLDLKHFAVASP